MGVRSIQLFDIPPQNPHTAGMEGRSPDIFRFLTQHAGQPFPQLLGSLICKGDRQNVPRTDRVNPENLCQLIIRQVGYSFSISLQGLTCLLRHTRRNVGAVIGIAKLDHPGNPVDDNCCFSASGTGQNQNRAIHLKDCLPLHRVEMGKTPLQSFLPKGDKIKIILHEVKSPDRSGAVPAPTSLFILYDYHFTIPAIEIQRLLTAFCS